MQQRTETALYVLGECQAYDHKRQVICGQTKLNPEEYIEQSRKDLYNSYNKQECWKWCDGKMGVNAISP